MRKSILLWGAVVCTVFTVAVNVRSKENIPSARIVRVKRGDVHQIIALVGNVRYEDESFVIAAANGVVSQLCKEGGERVAHGDVIARIESNERTAVLSALAMSGELASENTKISLKTLAEDTAAVRAKEACTVRQILVSEGEYVSAGTPVARVTSDRQLILCKANEADIKLLEKGMWAWLTSEGEMMGYAHISEISDASVDPLTGLRVRNVTLRPETHIYMEEGQPVDVAVYLAGSDGVNTLPIEAITARSTVWVVGDDGRCTEIPAEIVLCDEMLAWVQLEEGLSVAVGEFKEGQRIQEAQR